MDTKTKSAIPQLHQQLFEANRKRINSLLTADISHLSGQQAERHREDRYFQLFSMLASIAFLLNTGFEIRLASRSLDGETAIDMRESIHSIVALLARSVSSDDQTLREVLTQADQLWQKLIA